jgi:hypothetical protein
MRITQSITPKEDSRLIPFWSILSAAAAFVFVEYYFWIILPDHGSHPQPPLGLRLYFALCWGVVASLYFLMVGYVSRDAPRRGMSAPLWMLLCFVMPGGIGTVLYFLLRAPLESNCPSCGTHIQDDFHFCPQCNSRLSASCASCFRTVRATDHFCTRCGNDLEQQP